MCAAFRQNVRCDDLICTLTGRDGMPQSWDAIMTAAKRCARIEKSLGKELARNEVRNDINKVRQGKKVASVWSQINNENQPKESTTYEPYKNKQRTQPQASNRCTPLTKSSAQIMYTEGIQLKKPTPIKPGPNVDMTRYCDYHEQHGHTTNQCSNMKDAIEEYVKNGILEHLVKSIKGRGRRPPSRDGGRPEKKIRDLHANMITGGTTNKKCNQAEQAAWKEEQVIFPKVKGGGGLKGVIGNHSSLRALPNATLLL